MSKTAEKRRVKQEISVWNLNFLLPLTYQNILNEELDVNQKLDRLNALFYGHEATEYQTIVELVFRQHLVSLLVFSPTILLFLVFEFVLFRTTLLYDRNNTQR